LRYLFVISLTYWPKPRFAKWIPKRHAISSLNWKKTGYTRNALKVRVKASDKVNGLMMRFTIDRLMSETKGD
jgi:hypothetical protein